MSTEASSKTIFKRPLEHFNKICFEMADKPNCEKIQEKSILFSSFSSQTSSNHVPLSIKEILKRKKSIKTNSLDNFNVKDILENSIFKTLHHFIPVKLFFYFI